MIVKAVLISERLTIQRSIGTTSFDRRAKKPTAPFRPSVWSSTRDRDPNA
jgi:hypothetical protein